MLKTGFLSLLLTRFIGKGIKFRYRNCKKYHSSLFLTAKADDQYFLIVFRNYQTSTSNKFDYCQFDLSISGFFSY